VGAGIYYAARSLPDLSDRGTAGYAGERRRINRSDGWIEQTIN